MLYYNIFTNSNDAVVDTFKKYFGTPDNRKNKILLAALKDKTLWQYGKGLREDLRVFTINSLDKLYNHSMQLMRLTFDEDGIVFYSDNYKLDDYDGICEDGDVSAIRYARRDNGKVYKMKAGKFFRKLLAESNISGVCEQVAAYCAEEFARRWETYAANNQTDNKYTLVVDDDFEAIYDSYRCPGDFGSCMVDDGNYTFYEDAVDAHAASLRNGDDEIVARCIIFDRVQDDSTGKQYRLAERQYSRDGDEKLKRLLVDRLISEGKIDGYKTVGAGCGEARSFVPVPGVEFNRDRLSIRCSLEDGDRISYQDSFKWYDYDAGRADNYGDGDIALDTTDSTISFDNHEYDRWSDYNDEWINEDDAYYVESREDYFYGDQVRYAWAMNDRGDWYQDDYFEDDCIYINGEYYYEESAGIYKCPWCGEWFSERDEEYYVSEMMDETYCCFDCMKAAEEEEMEKYPDDCENWVMTDDGAKDKRDCDEVWYYDDDDEMWKTKWENGYYPSCTYIRNIYGFLVYTKYADEFADMLAGYDLAA